MRASVQVVTNTTCPNPSQQTKKDDKPPKRTGKDGKQYPAKKSWTAPEITPKPKLLRM
jgi:hypothetical protein